MASRIDRLDEFQRRHPVISIPLAIIYKFFDDQGPYLAALITYYGFWSAFPVLLLMSSVLGFLLRDHPDWEQRLLDSALSQFPIIGSQLHTRTLSGSWTAIVVGSITALYGTLGVAQAAQNAMNACWAVPRHRRPNPFVARAKSLAMIIVAALTVLAVTVLSTMSQKAQTFGLHLGSASQWLIAIASVAINSLIFLMVFRISTAVRLPNRDLYPGALATAIWWQIVQRFGTEYVTHVIRGAANAYGTFALVLGLLAWGFLIACGLVLAVELNVVIYKHLYPRALLTAFTDNVSLTAADKHHYTDLAVATRFKGFEDIQVRWHPSPKERSRAAEQETDGAE